MIKYHILALLCLVAAGISLIEILFILQSVKVYYTAVQFWLMVFVFLFSLVIYFRVKKLRKVAMEESERNLAVKRVKNRPSKK